MLKFCKRCKLNKDTSLFFKNKTTKDGFYPLCKMCKAEWIREDRKIDPKKYRAYTRRYWAKNRERLLDLRFARARRIKYRYSKAKSTAKGRNREFILTRDEYDKLITNLCFYCSNAIELMGIGLDRIDNNTGYTIDNVIPCCCSCNRTRGDRFSFEEMRDYIAPAIRKINENRFRINNRIMTKHVDRKKVLKTK